jgi:hypothetical protein
MAAARGLYAFSQFCNKHAVFSLRAIATALSQVQSKQAKKKTSSVSVVCTIIAYINHALHCNGFASLLVFD